MRGWHPIREFAAAPAVLLPLGALLGLAGCGEPTRETTPPVLGEAPERIVLIVIDTLRRDHVSAYGSTVATPHIDALAARGQRFPGAVASFHQTTMSMAALFTGRVPSLEATASETALDWTGETWCGLRRFAIPGDACVPASLPTLAEALGEAGYWTLGIVSNMLL